MKLWLVNHTTIAPVYLRVDVGAPPNCGEALVARVYMRFTASLPALPTQTLARREWETALRAELASVLSIPIKRVAVVQVDPIERVAVIDLLPADANEQNAGTTDSAAAAAAEAAPLPQALAERLQKLILLAALPAASAHPPAATGPGANSPAAAVAAATAAAIAANAVAITALRQGTITNYVRYIPFSSPVLQWLTHSHAFVCNNRSTPLLEMA